MQPSFEFQSGLHCRHRREGGGGRVPEKLNTPPIGAAKLSTHSVQNGFCRGDKLGKGGSPNPED